MSFFNNLLKPRTSGFEIITINSTADYGELPKGFFRVQTASGKETLGYNGSFISWSVGAVVVDGGRRIPAPTADERANLPLIKLNFRKQTDGIQLIGGTSVIDTDFLDGDRNVEWVGTPPSAGVTSR